MIPHCIQCQQQKYGPGNGFCFDCHNLMVRMAKYANRAKLAAKRDK